MPSQHRPTWNTDYYMIDGYDDENTREEWEPEHFRHHAYKRRSTTERHIDAFLDELFDGQILEHVSTPDEIYIRCYGCVPSYGSMMHTFEVCARLDA